MERAGTRAGKRSVSDGFGTKMVKPTKIEAAKSRTVSFRFSLRFDWVMVCSDGGFDGWVDSGIT